MRSRLPRVVHVVAILLPMAVLALLLLLADPCSSQDPPAEGDWTITDTYTASDTTITIKGNVTVESGASLTLGGSTLLLDLPEHGAYHVAVTSGGELYLYDSTIDSADRQTRYNITIDGAATISHSNIRRLDGIAVPNATLTPGGLMIRSSAVVVHNSTVEASNGFAVVVIPKGFSTISPVIENTTIRNNGGGIYCGGVLLASGDPVIKDCVFTSNSLADVLAIGSSPTITGCAFGALLQGSLTGVSAVLASPKITGCQFQFLGSAINSVGSSPTVKGCTVTGCLVGLLVLQDGLTGSPRVSSTSFSNCFASMVLNATAAQVTGCSISAYNTLTYAVSIDAGRPLIKGLEMDLSLFGGGISVVNGSTPYIEDCELSATGAGDVIHSERARPTVRRCVIESGQDGVDLLRSAATLEDNTIRRNSGWGVLAAHAAPMMSGNTFGVSQDANGDGRMLQLWSLSVSVEHEGGTPGEGAEVVARDATGTEVANVTAGPDGGAFALVLPEYEVPNRGSRVDYSPYYLEARLGELRGSSSVELVDDLDVTLVLLPDRPPTVGILFPLEGGEYNVWTFREGIPVCGTVEDPEGGAVTVSWYLDGEALELNGRTELDLVLEPGTYRLELEGRDGLDNVARASVNFTMVSVPPDTNWARIASPRDGEAFDPGEAVAFYVEYDIEDHPYEPKPSQLDVSWTSSLDGRLPLGVVGTLSNLSIGVHVITVGVHPRYPEYIPEPYTDTVSIEVLAPPPVAVANISWPQEGGEFEQWDTVVFSAEGSTLDIYDPPDHRVVYRWTSDIDGPLGEGFGLEARYLSVGIHTVTLELTTDPFIVSDEATVTVTIHPHPNEPPYARISLLTVQPRAGEPVNLSAAGSSDPEGGELTFHWDLGDGNTSSDRDVSHIYGSGGNLTVRLRVSDGDLWTDVELPLEVLPPIGPPPDGNGDNGDNGNGGDNGDGDDKGPRTMEDEVLGWVFLIVLLAAISSMLVLAVRERARRG